MRSTPVLMIAIVAAAAASLLSPLPAAGQSRGITPEDYFAFKTVNDVQLSPDGSMIAFVVGTVDQKQNRRYSAIWTVPADGSREPVLLTTAVQSSTNPRWSPDGRVVAFLSARPVPGEPAADAPRTQIWLLRFDGGEARRVTNLPNGVTNFDWSPDGTRLVVVGRTGPSDAAKSPSDVRHYKHANYKFNDTGWFDDRRSHLWVVDAASGAARQITDGQDWNDTDPQWSPDGARIAFVSDRSGRAYDDSNNTDVWTIPASGGPLTKISDHAFDDENPRWSPDGKQILFNGQ